MSGLVDEALARRLLEQDDELEHYNPWREYERRKRAIAETAETPREYEARILAAAKELDL